MLHGHVVNVRQLVKRLERRLLAELVAVGNDNLRISERPRRLRTSSQPAAGSPGVFAFTKAVNAQPSAGGLRGVFAVPAYRRLWAARTVSQWGDVFATVTLALLALRLTGSALGVTGVVLAEIVPVLLLAPPPGRRARRIDRPPLPPSGPRSGAPPPA